MLVYFFPETVRLVFIQIIFNNGNVAKTGGDFYVPLMRPSSPVTANVVENPTNRKAT